MAEVIDQLFAEMAGRFQAGGGADQDALIQWDVTTETGTRSYQMAIDAAGCSVTAARGTAAKGTAAGGAGASPVLMVGVTVADFAGLSGGQLDLMDAFLAGRVRLSGDLGVARQLQSWFVLPAKA